MTDLRHENRMVLPIYDDDVDIVEVCEKHEEEYPLDGQCHECWMEKRYKEMTRQAVNEVMQGFDELVKDMFGSKP